MTCDNNRIKQFHVAEYLVRCLDADLNDESMTMNSLQKINAKLQFLCRQNQFLNLKLRRLLCKFLIQLHFDYACISWYPIQKIRKKNIVYSK